MINIYEHLPKDADVCVVVLSDRDNVPRWFAIAVWYNKEWYSADFNNWNTVRIEDIYDREKLKLAVQYPDKTVPNGVLLHNLHDLAPDMFVTKYTVIGNVEERKLYEY